MIRIIDIFLSTFGLIFLSPVLLFIYILGLFDTGSPLFKQVRVGKDMKPFTLIKFRTMKKDTESVASHLVSQSSITKFGNFLRRTKLDELPQLFNVLIGDMSLVGPRPNLFNQTELIAQRQIFKIYDHRPGITGTAQLSGVDMSDPSLLAKIDSKMIEELNIRTYFELIIKTALGGGSGDAAKR